MKRAATLVILAAAPLLMAALWMDDQPSYRAYEAPVLAPPAGSVPTTGTEPQAPGVELRKPVAVTATSQAAGKALFAINCAMCHGSTPAVRGPVGNKLIPPPPSLDQALLKERSDAHLFTAITRGFGRMPPFQDKLRPQDRWDLVNYLRTRN
jgi:mono/diheme cytochrome c family protein